MKKRLFSLVLALSLCASLLLAPVSAADVIDVPNISWNDSIYSAWDNFFGGSSTSNFSSNICNSTYARSYYTVYSYSSVENLVLSLNSSSDISGYYFDLQQLQNTAYFGIRIYYRIGSFGSGRNHSDKYASAVVAWVCDNSNRAILCTNDVTDIGASPISTSSARSVGAYRMLSYEDLYNLTYDYNQSHSHTRYSLRLNDDGFYWAIASNGLNVLANASGLPYGAAGPNSVTASGNSRPDETTNDDHIIDWLNNLVGSNGGLIDFDNVIYDPANKTYYVDNSVSVVNNITNNYYYNWSYTYNIEYTNITYIGSSAEYTETYECYYELPDGRSSADLTKEDLEQLNLSMDVVPYIRSADDTRLRSLYHFDGNTEDASYWNYATSFDWTSGASLTYLESNAFNGCLYLDVLAHDFTIMLPSSIGSGDFTVDFRYYQSSTLAPQNDSFIKIGGQEVLRLTGSNFTFNGTNYATPVGNWQHLAFVREDGTLYFYLNGVRQGSSSFSNGLTSVVQFSFGSTQETYKYLDELRVTNFAVWEDNFTPPTVPYDTNLSLVLPTDTVPVADEYWDISMTGTNLLSQYNLDWWDNNHSNSGLSSSSLLRFSDTGTYSILPAARIPYAPRTYHNVGFPFTGSYSTPSKPSGSTSLYTYTNSSQDINTFKALVGSFGSSSLSGTSFPSDYSYMMYNYNKNNRGYKSILPSGISINLFNSSTRSLTISSCVFSIVFSDGYIVTVPIGASSDFDAGFDQWISDGLKSHGYLISPYICLGVGENSSGSSVYTGSTMFMSISPISGQVQSDIVYMALESGSRSTVSAELVSGIAGIPADDLNTPTLAVRSDIPITQKQIGGVRPTFAERGFVYAMVESGFITSLQQYTGYAWQAVDGRIWTGSRWIPYSSYNVITLSDMYDIADASGQGGYEYIYSESGFWSWWQKQWLEFKQWYTGINIGGGGGSSSDVDVNIPIIAPGSEWDFSDDEMNFVDFLIELPKTGYSMVNGLIKTVGNTLKNVPLALNTFVVQGNPLNPAGAFKVFIIPGT